MKGSQLAPKRRLDSLKINFPQKIIWPNNWIMTYITLREGRLEFFSSFFAFIDRDDFLGNSQYAELVHISNAGDFGWVFLD